MFHPDGTYEVDRDGAEVASTPRGWETRGLSLRAFALREGLNIGSLGNWRRRLKSTPHEATAFVSVMISDILPTAFVPFELVVRGGMSLRIPFGLQ